MSQRYLTPGDKRRLRRRWMRTAGIWLLVFAVLGLLDRPMYHWLEIEGVEDEDWYQMFRQIGYIPTWLFVAGAIALADWSKASRGGVIVLGAVFSGLTAEILKGLIGRERPEGNDGWYDFHPFWGLFNGEPEHMGFPSSHAGVAFGAALVVGRLFPKTMPLMIFAAAGCGLSRMFAGAHFLTDVVGAVLIAWVFARLLVPRTDGSVVRFGDGRLG